MRAEVFEIAVSALSFHGARLETPRIVQAARAVLVDGMRPGEAAIQYEFPPERVSEAVGRIRDKWAAICAERGLVTETFSLSARLVELIRQIELEGLQPLQAEPVGKRRKKAPAAGSTKEPAPIKSTAATPAKSTAATSISPKSATARSATVRSTAAKSTPAKSTAANSAPARAAATSNEAKQPLPKVAEKKPRKYRKPAKT